VEHGVTELVAGIDIVTEQIRLAAGLPLSAEVLRAAGQASAPMGNAIEVRLTAEDPAHGFAPMPGRVTRWQFPSGPGVRVDTGLEEGDWIAPEYDNLIAKVLVHGATRAAAIGRLRRALDEIEIGGIQTTLPFHRFVAQSSSFRAGELSTSWIEEHWDGEAEYRQAARLAQLAAGLAALRYGTGLAGGTFVASSSWVASTEAPWMHAGREAAVDRWPR